MRNDPLHLWTRRAGPRALSLLALGVIAGCTEQSSQTMAVETEIDAAPEIVASRLELTRIAEVAADPFVAEVLSVLPPEKAGQASGAFEDFGAKVVAAPNESFKGLETAILMLDKEDDLEDADVDSDADYARGVLNLYRDWAHVTLFGTEPDNASPRQ